MSLCEISFPTSDISFPASDISLWLCDVSFPLDEKSFHFIVASFPHPTSYRRDIVKYMFTFPKIIYDNDDHSSPILRQRNRTLVAENYIVESVTTFQDALHELQTLGFVDIAN